MTALALAGGCASASKEGTGQEPGATGGIGHPAATGGTGQPAGTGGTGPSGGGPGNGTGGHSGSGGSVSVPRDAGVDHPATGGRSGQDGATPRDAADAARGTHDASADTGHVIGDPGSEGDGTFTVGPSYPRDPQTDLMDHGAPKGRSFTFSMSSDKSEIFKGLDTTLAAANQHTFSRRIDVYVPARYRDGTAAPVLVIQDGPGPLGLVKNALDNLTASTNPSRRLPAFIAIAVQNGGGDGKGSERGLEYDTMSDRYARFINGEVFPAVLANSQIKAAYPGLAITSDPEGRGTLGCSSGGAAALIMGWFRPDLFRRIITYSGTFVDQQDDDAPEEKTYPLGAWEFHSDMKLIESSPMKPLRVFLNANQNDNGATAPASGHHNWLLANTLTRDALLAKGYHARYVFGAGAGHCQIDVQNQTLADTLVWAWRGYPSP